MGKISLHNLHRYIDKCWTCHQIANYKLIRIDSWKLYRIYQRIRKALAKIPHNIFHLYLFLDLRENNNNETLDQYIRLYLTHMHSKLNLFSLGPMQ